MYDILVIGGGPGGYAAAIRGSQLGGKVALVESGRLGGTCVNYGCIPSKVWLRAAFLYNCAKQSEEYGMKITIDKVNPKTVVERKNGVASEIAMGMQALLANNGVDLIEGRAVFKSPDKVDVSGKVLETKNIILATGSASVLPGIKGITKEMSMNQFLDMDKLPKKALVWGGSPAEVEAAAILNAFGVDVTLATDAARILPQEDHDSSQRLSQAMAERGVKIMTRRGLGAVAKVKGGYNVTLTGRKEEKVKIDRVVIGGRKPNTADMGLEQVGVVFNEDGGVKVDDLLKTSVGTIYAIGDVTGGWMLSHAASSMAVYAAENAMGAKEPYPAHLIPRGLWTMPQVAAVGLSEEEAEKQGFDVEVGNFPYAINGLAMAENRVEGSVKMITDAKYGDILGVHIVGENATELIGEAVLAIQMECTAAELAKSIRLHPTYSEAVVDAARDVDSWALYLPKG